MLAPEYVRSPIGISKFIVIVASATALILSGSTRPTDLQKEIVDSTWKEDGLFYLSIVGIVLTLMSVAWGIIFSIQCSRRDLRIKEMSIFAITCCLFLIFGSGTLESALNIFSRVGDCCQDAHHVTNNTCTLPGFLLDKYYNHVRRIPSFSPRLLDIGIDSIIKLPNIPECSDDLEYNSWRCTVCVNEMIQPNFRLKGASGAAGLIAALAYFIVVFVGVRELRVKKPSTSSVFRYD